MMLFIYDIFIKKEAISIKEVAMELEYITEGYNNPKLQIYKDADIKVGEVRVENNDLEDLGIGMELLAEQYGLDPRCMYAIESGFRDRIEYQDAKLRKDI